RRAAVAARRDGAALPVGAVRGVRSRGARARRQRVVVGDVGVSRRRLFPARRATPRRRSARSLPPRRGPGGGQRRHGRDTAVARPQPRLARRRLGPGVPRLVAPPESIPAWLRGRLAYPSDGLRLAAAAFARAEQDTIAWKP